MYPDFPPYALAFSLALFAHLQISNLVPPMEMAFDSSNFRSDNIILKQSTVRGDKGSWSMGFRCSGQYVKHTDQVTSIVPDALANAFT